MEISPSTEVCQNWINYLNPLSRSISVVLQGFARPINILTFWTFCSEENIYGNCPSTEVCQNWINYLNPLSRSISVVLQGFATYTVTAVIGRHLRDSQSINW